MIATLENNLFVFSELLTKANKDNHELNKLIVVINQKNDEYK